MSTPSKRRLLKDLKSFDKYKDNGLYAKPLDDDLLTWTAIIIGPKGTPFENGTFSLVLNFDDSYPQHPPEVTFISEVFHPNVYSNGDLCLDILKNRWSPSYDVLGILLSIQSLFNDPNTKSPANLEASKLFEENYEEYVKKVKECVIKSQNDIEEIAEKQLSSDSSPSKQKYDLIANQLALVYKCMVNIIPHVMNWEGLVRNIRRSTEKILIQLFTEACIQSLIPKKTACIFLLIGDMVWKKRRYRWKLRT